ncbi:hypothetical protein PCANC_12331 [Puccinia coronata f. sp. avenae]|uniref:Uncharacterized protein n=1 Tax=Puccinia coronata f. sp. avenae TaxID=200324 RepID=A0A2N5V3S3_9BASI|nr:hypothetical protein PCANC_12331 [Puccinia coronata f. sp. avenae]
MAVSPMAHSHSHSHPHSHSHSYSHTGTHSDPSVRKKRSSQHPINTTNIKLNGGRWKSRPSRPRIQLNAEERKQAMELLKKFSGRKNFALPVDLPPWSPPHKLEETSQDLSRIRDYYDSSPADWDRPELMKEESFKQPTHNQDEWAKPPGNQHSKPSPPSSSFPATTTAITTGTVCSSSASPDTFSSPSELSTKPSKARNGHPDQTYPTGSHNNNKASSNEEPPRDGASAASVKGKEKDDPEIDWTGWEPHGYKIPELEKLRALYSYRAKEIKRLSDIQRQHVTKARTVAAESKGVISENEEMMSDLSAVGLVDSLLLFTQSFLATELTTPSMTLSDKCSQWSSMIKFLDFAKSSTRRSGIQLTYAICLLLDRLVESDRPMLLQMYSHETDTEKLLEGFKKYKRVMNYQEVSKASWLSAEKMFERILSSSPPPPPPTTTNSSSSKETDRSYRNINLPKLKELLTEMKIRGRHSSPRILSLDRPYKFCWPIDKTNLDSMADFVVFSRCALDEFLQINSVHIRFDLVQLNDHRILFPRSPSSSSSPTKNCA